MSTQRQVRSGVCFKIRYIGLLLALVVFDPQSLLATSTKETVEAMLEDLALPLSGIISSGVLGPPRTLCGLPHFSLGIGRSISSLEYEDPFTKKGKTLPIGSPSLQARMGIFEGVDFGIRYGYLPRFDIFKEEPTLIGAELRIDILKVELVAPSFSLSITSNNLSKMGIEDEDWEVSLSASTIGAKIIVGRDLLFIHPYGAIGYEWCRVEADYEIDPLGGEEWGENPSFFRLLVGCELTIVPGFLYLGGEYNRIGKADLYVLGLRGGF